MTTGSLTINEILIVECDSDPSITGFEAPVGSLALLDGGARKWQKFGLNNTDWKEDNVAENVSYNNSISGLTATQTQAAIDELSLTGGSSASPGFTFGRSGTLPKGTYLLNDTVPSNIAGRVVTVNGYIKTIFIAQRNNTAFSLSIQTRIGSVFTTIHTVNIPAIRKYVATMSVSVSIGDELCAVISSTGNPQDVDIGVLLKGSL